MKWKLVCENICDARLEKEKIVGLIVKTSYSDVLEQRHHLSDGVIGSDCHACIARQGLNAPGVKLESVYSL